MRKIHGFRVGDEVKVLPSGLTSKIKTINFYNAKIKEVFSGKSVALTLTDDIDISRGDMITKINNSPEVTQDITAMLCWFNDSKAKPRAKYILRHTTNEQKAIIKEIIYKVDIDTFKRIEASKILNTNDICKVNIRVTAPVMIDNYNVNKDTGSFILIDEATNVTVAVGMIC